MTLNFARRSTICFLATNLFAATLSAAPEIPGKPQERPIALLGVTVHPVVGPDVANATLLIENGKISAIGRELSLPANVEKIDCHGKHVYPSLFDAYTNVGLVEIGAVRSTLDKSETGQINPNVKAQVAFNPDSELIPVGRSNGVLLAVTAPTGTLMSGTSSVMQMDGWTWEEMTLKASAGLHVQWPRVVAFRERFGPDPDAPDQTSRERAVNSLKQAFADAKAYYTAKKNPVSPGLGEPPIDARWEAMIPLLEGKLPLVVHADEIQQIQQAVAFAANEKVKLVIVGGYDAPHCAVLLKKNDVPVVVAGVHRLPQRSSEPYDEPYTVPRRLHEAGVRFCISGAEDPWQVRNLPYHAGTAAAYGLPKDEALKSVTLYPAQIMGVADRVGSLETGKDGTLIVTTGDVLEIPTRVEMAFIQGRKVDLSDRHKRLWEKYKIKYQRLGIQN